jgi:hypothetical protein
MIHQRAPNSPKQYMIPLPGQSRELVNPPNSYAYRLRSKIMSETVMSTRPPPRPLHHLISSQVLLRGSVMACTRNDHLRRRSILVMVIETLCEVPWYLYNLEIISCYATLISKTSPGWTRSWAPTTWTRHHTPRLAGTRPLLQPYYCSGRCCHLSPAWRFRPTVTTSSGMMTRRLVCWACCA